jgi:hypothetical protein
VEPGSHFRKIAVPNRIEQQLPQRRPFKGLTQYVKHSTAQGIPLLLDLQQQAVKHVTFACADGYEVPKVTNLLLADPVNTAEALLDPVRIPWQVIVNPHRRPGTDPG